MSMRLSLALASFAGRRTCAIRLHTSVGKLALDHPTFFQRSHAKAFSSAARRFISNNRQVSSQASAATSTLRTEAASTASTFKSASVSTSSNAVRFSRPAVGYWLLGCSSLVFGIVVLGGLTRLTESGLSIVEWRPVTGVMPPLNNQEWEAEFQKYKQYPEFKMQNQDMTLRDFKFIYFMEWGHRVWGRVIGMAFVIPAVYFAARKQIARNHLRAVIAIGAGIGFQGVLGWYMVKSGLDDGLLNKPNATARVSQYRLTAHLGTAFLVYMGMLWTGIDVLRSHSLTKGKFSEQLVKVLEHPALKTFRRSAAGLVGLVFLTAMSGGLVAGLDAGLIYNEFPRMGLGFVPPKSELFDPLFSHKEDHSDLWWRSFLENPTLVQFDHRVLATTTFIFTCALWLASRRVPLPRYSKTAASSVMVLALAQASLGICTLIYLVPVPLAAAHQAGSLALLTGILTLLAGLRVPSAARLIPSRVASANPGFSAQPRVSSARFTSQLASNANSSSANS